MAEGNGGMVKGAVHKVRGMVAGIVVLLLWAAPALGQVKGEIVSVGLGGINGKFSLYRPGAWVPVQVRVENRSGQRFKGHLGVEQVDLDGDKVLSVGPEFILEPTEVEGRLLWTYYWPRPDDLDLKGIKSVLVLDETGQQVVATLSGPEGNSVGDGIPAQDFDSNRSSRFALVMSQARMGWGSYFKAWGGTEAVRAVQVSAASQVPDRAKGLDGVDVIVWQADQLKVSDLSAEFQLKAILEWVRAGGHLVISVGTQGQEFLKAGSAIADAVPMAFTGTREIKLDALAAWPGCDGLRSGAPTGMLVQAVGTLKPGARPVALAANTAGAFTDHPLAVTALYGSGAITVLTIDAGNAELEGRIGALDRNWILFWNAVNGWQNGTIVSNADYEAEKDKDKLVSLPSRMVRLGQDVSRSVDVTEVTQERLVVAVLFLAVYWLLAGPLGHLVLKYYKVVHWSWWIFGGTVVVATALAGGVVFLLHVATVDVRHRSFVMGTVNEPQATVVGFYGVYTPGSGNIELALPAATGLSYLAPLCIPSDDMVKPFADPQSYVVDASKSGTISPVFRSTLKKLQARWTGNLGGISGTAGYTGDARAALKGELVNNSGYDLEDVNVLVYRPQTTAGRTQMYRLGEWKKGATLDLQKGLKLEDLEGLGVENLIQAAMWRGAASGPMSGLTGNLSLENAGESEKKLYARLGEDSLKSTGEELLWVASDLGTVGGLLESQVGGHHELSRGVARWIDRTKALRAGGAMIVARAGNIEKKRFVTTPLAVTVQDSKVAGKGEIVFTWALPLEGMAPSSSNEQAPRLGVEPPAPVGRGRAGRGRGTGLPEERP